VSIGSNVSVGVKCVVEKDLPGIFRSGLMEVDCTVVYGANNDKRIQKLSGSETPMILHVKHLVCISWCFNLKEYLASVLPQFHKITGEK
jgi:hypothetical protein